MVALIAVMGPQYVKYVQSSRDAVVGDAAESVLSIVKSEYAMNNVAGAGTITIAAKAGNGPVTVSCGQGIVKGANAGTDYDFIAMLGIDSTKTTKSDVMYTITVASSNGANTFSMAKAATGASTQGDNSAPAATTAS